MGLFVDRLRLALAAIPWLGPPDPKPYAVLARLTLKAQVNSNGELRRVMAHAANRAIRLERHVLDHARCGGRGARETLHAERRYAYERDTMLMLLSLPDLVEPLLASER